MKKLIFPILSVSALLIACLALNRIAKAEYRSKIREACYYGQVSELGFEMILQTQKLDADIKERTLYAQEMTAKKRAEACIEMYEKGMD